MFLQWTAARFIAVKDLPSEGQGLEMPTTFPFSESGNENTILVRSRLYASLEAKFSSENVLGRVVGFALSLFCIIFTCYQLLFSPFFVAVP